MKIDVHAHILPEVFHGSDDAFRVPIPGSGDHHQIEVQRTTSFDYEAMYSIDKRLRYMDNSGIDMHVLSTPPFYFYRLEPEKGLGASQSMNDELANVVAKNPDRFVALAHLPMQAPELAAQELERCVKELGIRGAEICTNINGTNLDDPSFDVLWAKMQELDVPFFLHPNFPLGPERLTEYYLINLIGFPVDSTVAAASLIFGGVLARFPQLKFYLAHAGGTCPYLRGRWEHGWRVRPEARIKIQRPPSEYFPLLFFDSLAHSLPALSFLAEQVGAGRIMLGTDYPFDMADPDPVKTVQSLPHLTDAEKELIFSGNAKQLLKIS